MKNVKWFCMALALALSASGLFFLTASAAAPTEKGPGGFRAHFLQRAKQKLGLTEEQSAQIKALVKADKDAITELLSRLHEARVGLRTAIQTPGAEEASIRVASAKVAAVEADLAVERLKLYGKISPILTAGQQEKLKEMQARMDDFVDSVIGRISERLAE